MMLGQMVCMETKPIIGLNEAQPLLDLLLERHAGIVHVLEDTELHVFSSRIPASCAMVRTHRGLFPGSFCRSCAPAGTGSPVVTVTDRCLSAPAAHPRADPAGPATPIATR